MTDGADRLATQFAAHRSRLRAVAYRILGSLTEADDAVQGTWLRLSRARTDGIDNLGGWLTTAVARECIDMLRVRQSRREDPLEVRVPDPIVAHPDDRTDPEQQALLADSVGLALYVVLETLRPAERVAFVLHDVFAVPHEEIAMIVDRSPQATRQLASRARRRIRNHTTVTDGDLERQREVVDAFLTAARQGDLEGLVAVLDPEVVIRADTGSRRTQAPGEVRGAGNVAQRALIFSRRLGRFARPAIVNGTPGWLPSHRGGPCRSSASPSTTAGSSRSTSSQTPNASGTSTWQTSSSDQLLSTPPRPASSILTLEHPCRSRHPLATGELTAPAPATGRDWCTGPLLGERRNRKVCREAAASASTAALAAGRDPVAGAGHRLGPVTVRTGRRS